MSNLSDKGQMWMGRMFKMIIFFAVMGMIVLSLGTYFLNNTMNSILKDVDPAPATKEKPAH